MPSYNRPRLIYSLAGVLLQCEWTAESLKAGIKQFNVLDEPLRVPKLAERLLTSFSLKPSFNELVQFLRDDAGLAKALRRPSFSLPPISRRRSLRRSKMNPPPSGLSGIQIPDLPSEAALAKWFGLDIQRLFWRADITGRNRKHPAGPLRTYRYRWIPKREGLPRLLEIPKAKLKEMQRKILEEILLNHRKTRIMRSGVRQHVTGVVVNVRPNIPRAEFDRLKAILTNCARHGPTSQNHQREPNFRDHLAGKIAHVASINPTRGDKLSATFKRIHWETAN